MTRTTKATDSHGWPVLLANVPSAGVSEVDPNAASGNPRHDVRSGKFGTGPQGVQNRAQQALLHGGHDRTIPVVGANPSIPPDQLDAMRRRADLVRAAARDFPQFGPGDVQDFLAGRVKDPAQVDVQAFLHDIHEARLDDIVDMIDARLRKSSVGMITLRRKVRVQAPRGWISSAFNGLTDEDVVAVMRRLQSLGHDPAEILTTALPNIRSAERRQTLESTFGVGG